jgi:hypothetical protein
MDRLIAARLELESGPSQLPANLNERLGANV